jgi:hypothetical protein
MPADTLAEVSADERSQEGADVDADVENREACVTAPTSPTLDISAL